MVLIEQILLCVSNLLQFVLAQKVLFSELNPVSVIKMNPLHLTTLTIFIFFFTTCHSECIKTVNRACSCGDVSCNLTLTEQKCVVKHLTHNLFLVNPDCNVIGPHGDGKMIKGNVNKDEIWNFDTLMECTGGEIVKKVNIEALYDCETKKIIKENRRTTAVYRVPITSKDVVEYL